MATRKQVVVRVPDVLHRKLKVKAAEEGRTITEIVRGMLEEWVEDGDDTSTAA